MASLSRPQVQALHPLPCEVLRAIGAHVGIARPHPAMLERAAAQALAVRACAARGHVARRAFGLRSGGGMLLRGAPPEGMRAWASASPTQGPAFARAYEGVALGSRSTG